MPAPPTTDPSHARRSPLEGWGALARGRGPWPETAAFGFLLLILLNAVALAGYSQLDVDQDGLKTTEELSANTSLWRADTDGDGLGDGWEADRGLNPLTRDSDGDGLPDEVELDLRADPTATDTDGDGLPDADEAVLPEDDCNANGIRAIADADDDSDGRPDAHEPPEWRCNPDVDGDRILDGYERALACIPRSDCDGDGLDDAAENGTEFDPIDPDSFDIGLRDSVAWTFQRAGQPPSGDGDGDGIPDAWESASGLIDWGAFQPRPNRTDLLMEFVRVLGPDSARYASLSTTGVHARLVDFFEASANVRLQTVETVLRLPYEPRPPTLPTHSAAYYRDLLGNTTYAGNPYVSTIVFNPQHDQTDVLHLGVAPIRGMLAAVDVGAHATLRFANAADTVSVTLSPYFESLIAGGRTDAIVSNGFTGGGTNPNGTFYLTTLDSQGRPARIEWTPYWFRTPPVVITSTGTRIPLQETSRTLDLAEITQTTLHEIGHTLGLCHTELSDCFANLSSADQPNYRLSTMHTSAALGTLHFLNSEWTTIRGFIRCAPEQPIVLLARNGTRDEILAAKYAYSLENATAANVRTCRDYSPLPADLEPDLFPYQYELPPDLRDGPRYANSARATIAFAVASELVCGFVAALPLVLKGRARRPGRPH